MPNQRIRRTFQNVGKILLVFILHKCIAHSIIFHKKNAQILL